MSGTLKLNDTTFATENAGSISATVDNLDVVTSMTLPKSATDPANPVAGDVYYNTVEKVIKNYDGENWAQMSNTFSATGGSVSTVGSYILHTFTSSGSFIVTNGSINANILVVAGGGAGGAGGGQNGGGGGGAGGVIMHPSYTLTPGTFSVTVGDGGTAGPALGPNGQDSSFNTLVAKGGGGGGANGGTAASDGGSGGGRGRDQGGDYGDATQPSQNGDSGIYGFGTRGGAGAGGGCQSGGGGGGAGGQGYDGAYDCNNLQGGTTQSDGGPGKQWSINSTYYGGGGGGAIEVGSSSLGSSGGIGGGGNGGGQYNGSYNATSGTPNTGGGGGGGQLGGSAGSGGSGIVIIAYEI
jgi:hypothetical protein